MLVLVVTFTSTLILYLLCQKILTLYYPMLMLLRLTKVSSFQKNNKKGKHTTTAYFSLNINICLNFLFH